MDLHDLLGDCSDESVTESSEETDKSFGGGKANAPSSLASSPAQAAIDTDAADDPAAEAAQETQATLDASQNRKDFIEVPEIDAFRGGDSVFSPGEQFEVDSSDSEQTSDTESAAAGPADRQPPLAIEIQPRSPGPGAHTSPHHDTSDTDSGFDINVRAFPTSPSAATDRREAKNLPEQYPPAEMTTVDAIRLVADILGEVADPALGAGEAQPGGEEELFDKLDVDHDGVISREEFERGLRAGIFQEDKAVTAQQASSDDAAEVQSSSPTRGLQDKEESLVGSPARRTGEQESSNGAGAAPESAEAASPHLGRVASSPSPTATAQASILPATPSSRLRALEATEMQDTAAPSAPPAAGASPPPPAPQREPEAKLQNSLCSHNISPSSIIQDNAEIMATRQKDVQPAENSENESVDAVSVDFCQFTTPDQSSASAADMASMPSQPLPGPPHRPRLSQMEMQGSHKKKPGVGATRQLIQELCRGAHRSQDEPQAAAARASQRRALAEAAAAFKETSASASARRLPPAPIPSNSSAYEPLGEPEPMRVWHTPDAPGLWIRHDAPRSEPPTPVSDSAQSLEAAQCEVAGCEAELPRPSASSAETKKTQDAGTSSQSNEAFRGMAIKASWLEDTPLLGPVERAMQSLLLDKTGELSLPSKTEPPDDEHEAAASFQDLKEAPEAPDAPVPSSVAERRALFGKASKSKRSQGSPAHVQKRSLDSATHTQSTVAQAKAGSPVDAGGVGQGQVFASLRNSARAKLLGAVAPETAGHGHACEAPSPAPARARRPEPQVASCPSLPQVPQLRSAGPPRQEALERHVAPSGLATCSRDLGHDREGVARTGDMLPCSGLPSLVSPCGASLPPRAGTHAGTTAGGCEDLANAPRQPQMSPASPSPVRLRPLPPVMTPEPRRRSSHTTDGDGNIASVNDSIGVESSTLGNIAQLFDTPAECSSIVSVSAQDMYTSAGLPEQCTSMHREKLLADMLVAASDTATGDDTMPSSTRATGDDTMPSSTRDESAAASCNSCIARAHQQVDEMRRQLLELAASCDTVECMAARLRAPLQPSAVQDHQKHLAWTVSNMKIPSAKRMNQGAPAIVVRPAAGCHEINDQSCLEELISAHEIAMQSAAAQLAALNQPHFEDIQSGAVEGASLKRLQDWVADMSSESRSRGPPCWAIAGMLEAAVEAIAQGASAPKVQFCSVVEAQLALPHCRQEDLAGILA